MRIISPFYDYYDCCTDPSDNFNIYVRTPHQWGGFSIANTTINQYRRLDFGILGFCGEIYPFKRLVSYSKDSTWKVLGIKRFYKREEVETDDQKASRWNRSWWYKWEHGDKKDDDARLKRLFEQYHTPIFLLWTHEPDSLPSSSYPEYSYNSRQDELITNYCSLGRSEFYRIKNPQQAAQEIEMYLFGVLGSQRREKIPPVSNSDMIEAKGFNLKTSFRKQKK